MVDLLAVRSDRETGQPSRNVEALPVDGDAPSLHGRVGDELLLSFPMYPTHAPDLRTAPARPPSVSAVPGIVSSNPIAVFEDLEIPVH